MALSDSKILFWNGKISPKSIHFDAATDKDHTEQAAPAPTAVPTLCGMPLKYISYVSFPLSPLTPNSHCWLRLFSVLWSNLSLILILTLSLAWLP